MKQWKIAGLWLLVMASLLGCAVAGQKPETQSIALLGAEGVENVKGTASIDTENGTEITLSIQGLQPGEVYTAFFVNEKSQMFEGIGAAPHVLPVADDGTVSYTARISKDGYIRFTELAIYLNPGGEPIRNPVGVKSPLGSLIASEKPTPVLRGKLR